VSKNLPPMRVTLEMLDQIERAEGTALPADVLLLCKLYRAAELTIRAQREVIDGHARKISNLLREKS
jgi:hypothetical protein